MPREYIRMFISWLRLIVRNTAFRSYASVLSGLLRLFRHCQAVIGGKERAFQEPVLALSSQPTDQDKPTSVTLAVPSFGAPLQSQGSNAVASNAQSPQNSYAPWTSSSMPEPSITGVATPLYPVVPKQSSDITLIPIIPGQIKRYERIEFQDENQLYEVQKGPLDWSDALTSVSGWEPLTHPEGALFFYHSNHRVFTDVNVRTDEIAVKMGKIAEKAYAEARDAGIILHPSVELVLELMEEDGKEIWGYYFADHDRRVIFWFQVHRSSDLMGNVRGVKCNNHVRYALESQYWVHIELYPNKRFLPTDVVVRLKEIVMYIQADNITSETCLAPFSSDEVASMLSLMDPLMSSTNKEHEHSVWIVARFMGEFTNAKFVNFCGQPGARLDADQSLYRDSIIYSKNILLRVMNVILFGTPDAHNKALHKIWVDHIVVQPRWKNFINRLNSEWNGYTIFSTVMLAVDISFLAVPSVQNQTPAILVSYLSAFCAMGSLVVSLVLAAHVNDSRRDSAKSVASFMSGMSRSMLGLESLALMLSLPFALLIWGMILFAAALSIVIFRTSDIVTISIVSPIWAVIIVLATWPALAANDIHISHLSTWVTEQVSRSRSSRVATRSHA
ncbi:uncharacterized protein EDB91DRAFT_1133546 [Suillus paluster]|uniref:uncharacterized protein n=1 Tax=Suillus paluster TaxID=48578 RepID=UPI001B86BEE0|nr:uncharacterized protein EDB91DRAFT_1133546 [Suillus paluster]KAG1740186.1 hypothetical protein EDB91DRAFT_1133546 [Suillus paluster]